MTKASTSKVSKDATSEGVEREANEVEQHFILRLPEDEAKQLHDLLENHDEELRNRFAIQFNPDMRHATVKIDTKYMRGKVVDLPCIIESLKTFDRKTVYKVANICQMLLIKSEQENDSDNFEDELLDASNADPSKVVSKKYLWNHGLTPPLKNVRKRRFRKMRRKKVAEDMDIEKELKRLLRADLEAEEVRWEVKTAEEWRNAKRQAESEQRSAIPVPPRGGEAKHMLREHDLFGGAVSSSEEEAESSEDEGATMARELMRAPKVPAHKPARVRAMPTAPQASSSVPVPPGGEAKDFVEGDEEQSQGEALSASASDAVVRRREALRDEITDVQLSLQKTAQTLRAKDAQLKAVENPALRDRLAGELENLRDEENTLNAQLTELRAQLENATALASEEVTDEASAVTSENLFSFLHD